jgi:hypothetical protein
MHRCDYLGTTIEIWTNRESWFWCVFEAGLDGGTIGAAATEAEAVRDACLSIEETVCPRDHADLVYTSVLGWERTLANLSRYLACGTAAWSSRLEARS